MAEIITKIFKGARVGDSYSQIKHPSGLTILLYPKEDCSTTCAVFGTRYGSIDNCFQRSDEPEAEKVPEGIAHYLEHKLFESEDGDAFDRFSKTGASANAFTSFESTCYLFPVPTTSMNLWKFFWTLYSRLTLQRKPCKKNKALSGRRSRCTMTIPSGE